jgi:neutral ceramidase
MPRCWLILSCLCSQSVRRAHETMSTGRVYLAQGELLGVSINRSPTAYLANPAAERAKYVTSTRTLT